MFTQKEQASVLLCMKFKERLGKTIWSDPFVQERSHHMDKVQVNSTFVWQQRWRVQGEHAWELLHGLFMPCPMRAVGNFSLLALMACAASPHEEAIRF
jgi:hypothetical protein